MGTKNSPGKFDCYEAADPDEPLFTLLGRDPLAGHLVSLWAKVRMGDSEAAQAVFESMMRTQAMRYAINPDIAKACEAMDCSLAMFRYRQERENAGEHVPNGRNADNG